MANFALSEKNVKKVVIGLIVMIAGYILMMGGGSSDPNVFNPQIFSFTRLFVSPLLVICGIIIIIVAIMKRPKEDDEPINKK